MRMNTTTDPVVRTEPPDLTSTDVQVGSMMSVEDTLLEAVFEKRGERLDHIRILGTLDTHSLLALARGRQL